MRRRRARRAAWRRRCGRALGRRWSGPRGWRVAPRRRRWRCPGLVGSSRSGGGHDGRSPPRGSGGAHRPAHGWRFGQAGRLLLLLVAGLGLLARPAAAQTEVIEYYGHDALGSVRIVFTASGVATARADYEPFGEGVTIAGMPAGPLPAQQFTGQERDALERQDYFGARYYRPRHGRFSQVDPVYAGLFDPQQWNRYAYARNNPLTFVDPDGRNLEALDRPAFRVEVEYCSSCDNRFFIQMQLMWYFPGIYGSGLGAGSGPDGSGEPGRGRGHVGVGPTPPGPTPGPPLPGPTPPGPQCGGPGQPPCPPICGGPGQPPCPKLTVPDPKVASEIATAVREAASRLGNEGCRSVFNGAGAQELYNVDYRYDSRSPLGGYPVHTHVPAAPHLIYLGEGFFRNPRGPFPGVPRTTAQSFIVLHEFGHVTHVLGPDRGNGRLQQAFNARIATSCR